MRRGGLGFLGFGGADLLGCPNPRDFGELSRAAWGIPAPPSGFDLVRGEPRHRRRVRFSSGFTLVELLVVVGVLVFFIAMLIPALSKAQRQSRTLTCLSNLRQLHLGFTTYLHENREHSLPYDPAYKTFWPNALRPTFPDVKGILLCPEANNSSYGWGTANCAWGPYDAGRGSPASMSFLGNNTSSYGFNGWLYEPGRISKEGDGAIRWSDSEHVPVFAESKWVDGWPAKSDVVSSAPAEDINADAVGLWRFNLARHGLSLNASFLDGHAEQIPLSQLQQQDWADGNEPAAGTFPSR